MITVPERQPRVSASRMAAILNRSPYSTRFLEWHRQKGTIERQEADGERLDWGNRLQDDILAATANELRLDIEANDEYHAHPVWCIGAKGDGYCRDPVRGLGVVEAKNVDWFVWKDTWTESHAPEHVEIQHQVELATPRASIVVDSSDRPLGDDLIEAWRAKVDYEYPTWGVIAALVGGNDLKLYRRRPLPDLQRALIGEAESFRNSVLNDGPAPSPVGMPIELPYLAQIHPVVDPKLTLRFEDDPELAREVGETIRQYDYWASMASAAEKTKRGLAATLLAIAGEAATIRVKGAQLKVSKYDTAASVLALPDPLRARLTAFWARVQPDDPDFDILGDILQWQQVTRAAARVQRLSSKLYPAELAGEPDPFGLPPAAAAAQGVTDG